MVDGVPDLVTSVIFVAYIQFMYVAFGLIAQPGGPHFGHAFPVLSK
jgi:hypothetical protein